MQGAQTMQNLIDKFCDHLPSQRIKLFIQSGFDQWETVTFMKGQELVELGFNPQECIIIMVAINSQAKEVGFQQIFCEAKMQQVLKMAKQAQAKRYEDLAKEEMQQKMQKIKVNTQQTIPQQPLKQYPLKPITEAILLKGVTLKGKQKVPLNKITLMSLEEKEITHIAEMEKVAQLQNLHLSHNHIYKIENLNCLNKLRVLKLEGNQIVKMEGFSHLQSLQQLYLADNHISRFQGLENNSKLHLININNQRTKQKMTFDENTCASLAYCLQVFFCENNRVSDITNFKYLKVINTLHLRNNQVAEMENLSQPLGGMERLKTIDFRGNPLCTLPKYRDYIVILCKTLDELDLKKILPKEREYLVKLYSLKHAKQMREESHQMKKVPTKESELQITKLQEGQGMYTHGSDLRGNVAYANTKIQRN